MLDPDEGLTADGMIRTGAHRFRVPVAFEPVLAEMIGEFNTLGAPAAELYLYGSVATGMARAGQSDVDLLLIDGPEAWAQDVGARLSRRHADLCRGVEIGVGRAADYTGSADESYGNRVFLRHYCVSLAGPAARQPRTPFAGDARAARGFNGDIAFHLQRWRSGDATARAVARKSLLAAAGVVSVRARTWTTDRATAARAWAEFEPGRSGEVQRLLGWADGTIAASPGQLAAALARGGVVTAIADRFASEIGLWSTNWVRAGVGSGFPVRGQQRP